VVAAVDKLTGTANPEIELEYGVLGGESEITSGITWFVEVALFYCVNGISGSRPFYQENR